MALTATDVEAVLPHLPDVPIVLLSSMDVYEAWENILAEGPATVAVPFDEDGPLRANRYPYRGRHAGKLDDYDKLDVEPAYLARQAARCASAWSMAPTTRSAGRNRYSAASAPTENGSPPARATCCCPACTWTTRRPRSSPRSITPTRRKVTPSTSPRAGPTRSTPGCVPCSPPPVTRPNWSAFPTTPSRPTCA
jgi:hypothetical protein